MTIKGDVSSGIGTRRIHSREGLKHALGLVRWNAGPAIEDLKDRRAVLLRGGNLNAAVAVAQRVVHEVGDEAVGGERAQLERR